MVTVPRRPLLLARPTSVKRPLREVYDTAWNLAGHADAEARRSVLTALQCATLVTVS